MILAFRPNFGPHAMTVVVVIAALPWTAFFPARGRAQDEQPSSRSITDVLAETTEIVAQDQPLVRIILDLQDRHHISILFDNDIVPGSPAYGDPRVTCDLRRVKLGHALREILAEVHMDYIVRSHDVLVVTREKARVLKRWPGGSARSVNETKIATALEEPTQFDFSNQPLTDVLAYLKEKHQIDIQLDTDALKSVGSDVTITRAASGITLESGLDLILNELDLVWSVRDEVLLVTTKAGANRLIETRVYPVYDLVMTRPGEIPPPDGPDYDALVEVLSEAAAVDDVAASPIRVYRPAGALVITRPAINHRRIEKLLTDLRRTKAGQSGGQ
ncbi:MAG TPA: hypothetical protein VHC22_23610 [Pirellulales bacterium]|nr:hypothetical protein [Pirellulales bacterium]